VSPRWARICALVLHMPMVDGLQLLGAIRLSLFVWAVVFESDGVTLTPAWCGKTRHGGDSSSRPRVREDRSEDI